MVTVPRTLPGVGSAHLKMLFVAVLLGAVTAAGAACQSETPSSAVVVPAEDAAIEPEEASVEAGPPRVKGCPGEAPATYAWQPPVAKVAAACTEADLAKLGRAIGDRSLTTAEDIAAALGPSCAACAIGRVEDPKWRAVVGGHEGYIGNVGGCAIQLGAKEICGQAIDRLSTCLILGCDGCVDRRDQDQCADALTTVDGVCAAPLKTMRKECPAATLASAFDTNGVCQSFVETIRLFCGPPAQDGG